MTKLEFFKQTLNEFLKLKERNDKYNKVSNEILENDMIKDFPVYLSDGFCFPYETLVLESLAQLWNNPKEVKDWIEYLIYEAIDMKNGGHVEHEGKKYPITNVEDLCDYLVDYYHILGECKCK